MPFLVRYPKNIQVGELRDEIVLNIDFAPTLLDYAGITKPEYMQGSSFRQVLEGNTPPDWELYDLEQDPQEVTNLYSNPECKDIVVSMKEELLRLKTEYNDQDSNYPNMAPIIQKYW